MNRDESKVTAASLWREAVRAGEDYPCKYWGVAACGYRNNCGCDCAAMQEYQGRVLEESLRRNLTQEETSHEQG